jgi:hypothetical protein
MFGDVPANDFIKLIVRERIRHLAKVVNYICMRLGV